MSRSTNERVLAVIPARGGSKGLPLKNIAPLSGRPLISYSIQAARGCRQVDRCVVSTDHPAIKKVALENQAEVVDRPAEISGDKASSESSVLHVLKELKTAGYVPDIIALLQPTSPLRTAAHLDESLTLFKSSQATSLLSVCHAEHTPFKMLKKSGEWLEPLFAGELLHKSRLELPETFRQNGAIYLIRTADFIKHQTFFVRPCAAYVMPIEASIDVDTSLDLQLCAILSAA